MVRSEILVDLDCQLRDIDLQIEKLKEKRKKLEAQYDKIFPVK